MNCTQCGKPAVLDDRQSGKLVCKDHFLRGFDRRVNRELAHQGRLPSGRIGVALSGGKDSVSLLHALAKRTRDRPDIELVAITIDEGIEGYRPSSLVICEKLCQDLDVTWHVERIQDLAGYTIDEHAAGIAGPDAGGEPRAPCGPCGIFRRQGLNEAAKKLGCVAIATGHNLDDMAQTVLMNLLKGEVDRLGRLAPHKHPQPGMIPRLIPFRQVPEKEVLLYAVLHGLPLHHEAECPYAARAQRFALRDHLLSLEERSPGTKHSLLKVQDRIQELLGDPTQVGACPQCGGPSQGGLCKPCQWKQGEEE